MGAASLPLIALTAGEPAGIGPDLCALLSREEFPGRIVILADPDVVAERSRMRSIAFDIPEYRSRDSAPLFSILPIRVSQRVVAGRLDPANARHVVALLDCAIDGCMRREFDAMVTAPTQKSVLNDAGIPFTGHTEYLAQRTGTPLVVMLLVGGGLRVALATTHLALSEVPAAIERGRLEAIIRIIDTDLDTLFTPRVLAEGDVALAMFHDQGLPVLKHAAFGQAVNVTLGLPMIRTSVDHGTALDRAGAGEIDAGSLREAAALAFEMAARRR